MNYSLRKSHRILRNGFKLFQKKGHKLAESLQKQFEGDLRALDQAVLSKRKEDASLLAKRVNTFIKTHFPKTLWDHLIEIAYALAFAIVVAFFIRQFWFELYEVPTGSMRPTVEELDRMVVSKTTFGINIPFRKKPLFFSDEYINRAGIIVFTVEGMDVADSDMIYFHIIPGKKRFIKRCVAKPGDTIYFYGGQLYAVDKEGNGVITQADPQFLEKYKIGKIDHIPYITFDGKTKVSRPVAHNVFAAATLKQMNLPVAKLEVTNQGKIEGKFYNGQAWTEDRVAALKAPHDKPMSYSDLWGIGNYAMTRILTKEEVERFYKKVPEGEDSVGYLELSHTPNLTYPKPELRKDERGLVHPMITPFTTVIPLKQSHLDTIFKNMFTARFIVENGSAYRYNEGHRRPQRKEFDPKFPGVPNGCYEFDRGIAYKIHFGGIRTELPATHPLYNASAENIRKLYNLGIGFNIVFEPMALNQPYNPQRFGYYRDGDLYTLGVPIFKKNDPTLIRFVQNELEKQKESSREQPYIAFIDHGPPLTEDGKINIDFIDAFGLKVPDNGIVALGDNYAMSADSRDFGFVPTENLRGAPSFTFWPPGSRLGTLPQPPYPWITLPNLIVWTLVVLIAIVIWSWLRRRNKRSLF